MNRDLIAAAEAGDVLTVRQLLTLGADINQQDDRGRTPVMAATHANNVEIVSLLIDAGADIDLQDNKKDNVFLYAGAEGLLEILRLAIQAGPNTKLVNRYGGSALIPAAERGHVEVVEEILTTTDVNVDHINNLGWTALLEAVLLTDGGPDDQAIVSLLIQHGANVNIPDKDGVTALHHARARGAHEIEKLLLDASAI